MTAIVAWMLLGVIPTDSVVVDRVDVIEVNHILDQESGKYGLHQLIFWKLRGGKHEIAAWILVPNPSTAVAKLANPAGQIEAEEEPWFGHHMEPQYDRRTRRWVCLFRDARSRCRRKIISPSRRVTWTALDIEVLERDVLPLELRVGVSPARPLRLCDRDGQDKVLQAAVRVLRR